MKNPGYFLRSFLHAAGVFVYVSFVAWLMFNNQKIFDEQDNFLVPVFMLLLFLISATVTGLLVLGKPIHMYMNGLRREAFTLLFATLVWLVLFFLAVAVVLLLR